MLGNLDYKWKVTVGYQATNNGTWFTLNNEYISVSRDDFTGTNVESGKSIKKFFLKSTGGKKGARTIVVKVEMGSSKYAVKVELRWSDDALDVGSKTKTGIKGNF